MLTIRFNRIGKKNKAYFRIALQEHTVAPGGRHVEVLGSYDPHLKKAVLKAERINYWVQKGAQVSDSAYNLFIKEGVLKGKKRMIKLPKKAEPASAENPTDAKSAAEKIEAKEKIEAIKYEPAETKTAVSEEKKEESVDKKQEAR